MDTDKKKEPETETKSTITVAGITFAASNVVSAVVKLDGRKIHIAEKEEDARKIGF